MTLRRKLATRVGAVTLLFALLAAGLAGWASLRGFRDVDERDAVEDATRVQRAIEREIEQLESLTRDWSAWDDTLRFVTTGDGAYAESNLVPGTLDTLELSDLVIADPDGRVVWATGYDAVTGESTPADPELLSAVVPSGILHTATLEDGYAGPLLLESGPVLAVAQPITDSLEEAPAAGTFIMVRSVDEAFITSVGDRVRRVLALEPPAPETAPTTIVGEDHVLTRVAMRGADDQPVADLVVRSPRQATAVGLRTIGWMSLVLLATVTLAGVTTFLVIDRSLVRRLVRTRDAATAIGRDGTGRLEDDGHADELSDLRAAVNDTVASLEATRSDLAIRNDELLELARFRKDLIAMVSHELRAPLAAIRGFAQTLDEQAETIEPDRRAHLVERITANAERLNRMVNDLLLLASADDGQLPTSPAWVRLDEVVSELQEDLDPAFDATVPTETTLVCDADHLRRIVINLVMNAHSHGAGPIEVEAATEGDRVRLSVRDHGPGVPEEFVPSLFQRFSQASPSTRDHSGVGLGLSIVHALARANGGTVSYEHAQPGARFTVELPSPEERDLVSSGSASAPAVG